MVIHGFASSFFSKNLPSPVSGPGSLWHVMSARNLSFKYFQTACGVRTWHTEGRRHHFYILASVCRCTFYSIALFKNCINVVKMAQRKNSHCLYHIHYFLFFLSCIHSIWTVWIPFVMAFNISSLPYGLGRIEARSIFQVPLTSVYKRSPIFPQLSFKFTPLCKSQLPKEQMNLKWEKDTVIHPRSLRKAVLEFEFSAAGSHQIF